MSSREEEDARARAHMETWERDRQERDHKALIACHDAYALYVSGRISRDEAHARCRRALLYAPLAARGYVWAQDCWLCGASQYMYAKVCEVCGAPLKKGLRCAMGRHAWKVEHDTGANVYRECQRAGCHERDVQTKPNAPYQPIDREWLRGASWVDGASSTPSRLKSEVYTP